MSQSEANRLSSLARSPVLAAVTNALSRRRCSTGLTGARRPPDTCCSRSGDELPRVGFFDPKDGRNLPVWIVERLSKHVRGALGWRKLLQQKQHRRVQRLASFGPQARIAGGVDRLRQPGACTGLSARASGLEHVDRQSRGRGNEERQRIPDRAAIGGLPPNPDVLDDVLGLSCAAQHPIGDGEQTRTDA